MADLTGLPDFGTMSPTGAIDMFAPFGSGHYAVLPQQLVVSKDADGNPKFQLELINRIGDFSSSGQYAVLDFALDGDFPLDDALTVARSGDSGATVAPVVINSGFARLYPTTNEVVPSQDLLLPIPLGWNGSNYARWTMRLSMTSGELMKGSLSGGSLLLGVRLEFDVLGVAPRVPVAVDFVPAELVASLLAGRSTRQMAASDVLSMFAGDAQNFPLKVTGTPTEDFADAVASRIIAAYGSLVPSPGVTDPAFVAFRDAEQLATTMVHWDLSQPSAVYRQWVLMLDPMTGLRDAAVKNGIDSLVKNVTIPALQLGFHTIDVTANLPSHRSGVPALGVNIQVPAHPPFRPSSISQTLTLTEPQDSGSIQLRLGLNEALNYTVSAFAVVVIGQSEQQYQTDPGTFSDTWLRLSAGDFPVTFAHVTASSRLVTLAKLSIALNCTLNGQPVQEQFALSTDAPDIAVGIPQTATNASLAITAAPHDGGSPLTLPAITPGRIFLDVTSFREFGSHVVAIQANFNDNTTALFLDLLREDQATDANAVPGKVLLTPDQPSATWSYFAGSPFHPGYLYRRSGSTDLPPGAWSTVLSPIAPLVVNADGSLFSTVDSSNSQPASAPAVASH